MDNFLREIKSKKLNNSKWYKSYLSKHWHSMSQALCEQRDGPPSPHQSVRRRRNSPPCYYERPWTVNGSSHDRSSVEIYNGGKWVSKNCQNSRMIVQRWKTVLWQPQGAINWKQFLIILLQKTDEKDVKHIASSPRPDHERPSSLDWPSGGGHWAITIILQLWWPLLQSWPLRCIVRSALNWITALPGRRIIITIQHLPQLCPLIQPSLPTLTSTLLY